MSATPRPWSRRELLGTAVSAAGALWLGCGSRGAGQVPVDDGGPGSVDAPDLSVPVPPGCSNPFAGGERLETLAFLDEDPGRLDVAFNSGLDGRLYTDLSTLTPETLVTPNERFYIRTRYPDTLDPAAPWSIAVGGLVEAPITLTRDDLEAQTEDQGLHLLECSGNGGGAAFGLLSSARWAGVPVARLLDRLAVRPAATRLRVTGYDRHSQPSERSQAGASWVFTLEELAAAGAFLATRMNGEPLPLDHGYPVRLVMPGWYGCTCIKWLDALDLVDDEEPATPHMQEFASRTHQDGVPALARDFRPASMDQAAMPVRVVRWRVGGETLFEVTGILWGGSAVTRALVVRFNDNEPWVPVDVCPAQTSNATWTLFTHVWRPASEGSYTIRLRIDDPAVPQRRLDSGFYTRRVAVTEI